jgi:hypothetical protein
MPVHGREKLALDLGVEVNEYWGKLAAEGKCSEPEMFFYADRGMWMVKGDLQTLRQLCDAEEVQRQFDKGQFFFADYDYELVRTGDAAVEHLLRCAGVGQELGFV